MFEIGVIPERNLAIKQASQFLWTVDVVNTTTGLPVDVTGWDAQMQFRTNSGELLGDFVSPGMLTPVGTTVTVDIPGEVTAGYDWTNGVYDLFVIDLAGESHCVVEGQIRVIRTVTDLGFEPGPQQVGSLLVHRDGIETITGAKTFTEPVAADGGVTVGGVPLLPPRSFQFTYLSVPLASSNWVSTIVITNTVAAFLNGYHFTSDGATTFDLNFMATLRPGTYTVLVRYTVGPNLGQFTVIFDGQESAIIDSYFTSFAERTTSLTFTIATGGDKTIRIRKKATKNAASAGFIILWSAVDGAITS